MKCAKTAAKREIKIVRMEAISQALRSFFITNSAARPIRTSEPY
jgi:hypothetical protein